MRMLGTVLTHLLLKVTSAISTAQAYLTKKLSELRGVLTNLKTQFVALQLLLNQFVQVVLKLKVLLAQFITLALSIKSVLTNVVRKVSQNGQPSATTVAPTHQPVKRQRKKGL